MQNFLASIGGTNRFGSCSSPFCSGKAILPIFWRWIRLIEVDWIGLDGYNFYPQDPWGGARPLRDFDNCFRALYDACAVLGDQPMMIAEFGTGEFEYEDFDKAAWVTDAFNKIKTEYPRLRIFTWFNINKELDWRVNSSPEALDAFQEAMEDPYYIGSPYQQ